MNEEEINCYGYVTYKQSISTNIQLTKNQFSAVMDFIKSLPAEYDENQKL